MYMTYQMDRVALAWLLLLSPWFVVFSGIDSHSPKCVDIAGKAQVCVEAVQHCGKTRGVWVGTIVIQS